MSESSPAQISVVIPTRNRPDLLRRTLDCLSPGTQTLAADRYEVVVSDDAKPATAAALLAQSHPWVRVVEGPARGPAANRNTGARAARGTWVAFTDDDCEPSVGWLAAMVRAVDGSPAPDVLEGRTTCVAGIHSPLDHAPINETGGVLWSCNVAVRRETFVGLGGFDERFPHPHMEDVEFRERAKQKGLRITFVPDAVIDHPPRRLAFGGKLGETHYGALLYARMTREDLSCVQLLRRITSARLRAIARHGGTDFVPAIGSWVMECACVISRWSSWQQRASAAVPAT